MSNLKKSRVGKGVPPFTFPTGAYSYPRGDHYGGAVSDVAVRADYDLNFIVNYGSASGGWVDLH